MVGNLHMVSKLYSEIEFVLSKCDTAILWFNTDMTRLFFVYVHISVIGPSLQADVGPLPLHYQHSRCGRNPVP